MKQFILLFIIVFTCKMILSQTKVAIVGGGIAGVASAYYIHQFDPSAQITIYEKEDFLGGNAKTVEIVNKNGITCNVDIGPQYFTEGPWDNYLKFLDDVIGLESIETESVQGSLLIKREDNKTPTLLTPIDKKLRGEKLGKLLRLKKFNTAAFNVYKNPEQWIDKTIDDWVVSLKFSLSFKNEIIYPFLAATLGTDIQSIKTTSAIEIVNLFAFRKPKVSNSFSIMTKGMGGLIQAIGNKLEQSGVIIKTSSPVHSITKEKNRYTVLFQEGNKKKSESVDFIVMAVHADIAGELLRQDPVFDKTSQLLISRFPYFKAHIVLHSDANYIYSAQPAFLNIFTNITNEVTSSTMNLSMISPRLEGIYKSWMSEKEVQQIKEKGLFLHETTFYHPLITPSFVNSLGELHLLTDSIPGICFAGGWTEGLETQNSAVLSGKRALQRYQQIKND